MTIFAEALITAMVVAFVLYPLFRREPESAGDQRLGDLRLKRDNAYVMLGEIESDHEAGALSEKDYRELSAKYRQKAGSNLKELDKLTGAGAGDINEEIEKSVKQLRHGKKSRFCSQCGARVTTGDRFCPNCGKSLVR